LLGAIVGDIVGSRFEFQDIAAQGFELFGQGCRFTDDTVMTAAVAAAILDSKGDWSNLEKATIVRMRSLGQRFAEAGYGSNFKKWLFAEDPKPYESFGNGAAMRVSPCGLAAESIEEATIMAHKVTAVSHNHPEGLKGAEATAVAVFMAKRGDSAQEIGKIISDHYYQLDYNPPPFSGAKRPSISCQVTVPRAMVCFLSAKNYEEAIRRAVYLGGDTDTTAAIAGSVAGAYFSIPATLKERALALLDPSLVEIVEAFEAKYAPGLRL
jgi:type I restriction enzyme M protein